MGIVTEKVRQREQFNILMENWDRVKELTEESANAAGTADEKYSAYMDSMEAATKRLQNAWEGFTQSLETSTVMKFLTNATAAMVENADKLKYLVTVIAAAGSARIFDFFTNKGETGGFKGLIANIPFIGRGTKTNNILESIDKKVGNIEKGVGADSLANQTKNGGFFRRIGGFLKTGFGRGDIYDPETGKSISYNLLKKYQTLRDEKGWMPVSQMETYSKLLKQRQIGNAAMGATSAVLTNLLTTKQVGGGVGGAIGKFLTGNAGNEQTIEETSEGKALRTLASGGLAAAGGAFFGPLGAMLGQTIGEGAASIVSTIVHRSELEMKQRVADAKENLSRLDAIKSTMETNNSIMTEELTSSEDFEKLYKYTDDLYDKLFELQYEGNVNIIGAINNAYETFKGVENITSIRDLCDEINNGNADQRSMIKRQLELAEAQINLEQLTASQEEERARIGKELEVTSGVSFFDNLSGEEKSKALSSLYQQAAEGNETAVIFKSLYERREKAKQELEKLDKQLVKSRSNVGFLAADIHDLTTVELKDLTMDGVVGLVVKALEDQGVEVRNAAGYIKDEYQDAIEKLIKSDSKFNALQQADTKTLGQLTSAQERFSSMLEEQTELVKKYGKSWDKWYDAAKRGKLSEEIAKIVYAANPERIEQFARAWNTTREGLEKLTKEFPDLTTAIGLMSPSEVREYYSVFTDLFEDLATNSALTAENFEKLINQYPQLLKYYKNGTLSTELLSKANEEQRVAYANAMLSAELSNAGIGEDFLAAVKSVSMGEANEEAARFVNLTKESAETILKEIGSVKSLNEVLDIANALRQKGDEDAARALEELVEQYLNYEKVIEWTDPIYAMAQQGEIDRLTQEIENLNEQKDALSNVNDERQRELDLIKAKEALENARKEKKRVYRQGKKYALK